MHLLTPSEPKPASAPIWVSELHPVNGGSSFKQGPRNRLSRAASAAAPEGLEPAAPKLLEQLWTGDRGEASREPRPARPRELHAVSERGGQHYAFTAG